MAREQEIEWQSYVGVSYELQSTVDGHSWQVVQTFQGNGQKQSYVAQTTGAQKTFRLKQTFKDGEEPLDLLAITAWDGTYVKLQWSLQASPLAGRFKILRDNQQIAEVPFMSIMNTYTHSQPGTGRHTYSVTYWN